jgi:hypothetical protein
MQGAARLAFDLDLALERQPEPRPKGLAQLGSVAAQHHLPSAAADGTVERDLPGTLRTVIEMRLQLQHLRRWQLTVQERFPRSVQPWAGHQRALLVRR